MKSSWWAVVVCLALFPGFSEASDSNSINLVSRPVGFVRITISAGEQRLVSLPFHAFDPAVASIFSNQLSESDAILKWNPELQAYEASNFTLEAGEAAWIENKQDSTQAVYLLGAVNLDDEHSIVFQPGLNTYGYPYSIPPTNGAVFGSGEWAQSDEVVVWTEQRPYADVFPQNDDPPQITGLSVTEEGKAVTLTIEPYGTSLDVYYKDVSEGAMGFSNDWKIAEADIPIIGKKTVQWTDRGNEERSAPCEVRARYYMVGLSDVDMDGNGIPDSRQQFMYGEAVQNGIVQKSEGERTAEDADYVDGCGLMAETNNLEAGQSVSNGITMVNVGRIIYVDKKNGKDSFTGKSKATPKKTIEGGMAVVQEGDRMVIKEGFYREDLKIAGRDIKVMIDGDVKMVGRPAVSYPIPISGVSTN